MTRDISIAISIQHIFSKILVYLQPSLLRRADGPLINLEYIQPISIYTAKISHQTNL